MMVMRNRDAGNTFGAGASALLAGAAGLAAVVLVGAASLVVSPEGAQALPAYAQQTKLPCGQCHTNPSGGGALKSFGQKFQANGHKLK
jgi:hypothetical protein